MMTLDQMFQWEQRLKNGEPLSPADASKVLWLIKEVRKWVKAFQNVEDWAQILERRLAAAEAAQQSKATDVYVPPVYRSSDEPLPYTLSYDPRTKVATIAPTDEPALIPTIMGAEE